MRTLTPDEQAESHAHIEQDGAVSVLIGEPHFSNIVNEARKAALAKSAAAV